MGALTHNGEVMQGLPADASQINFDKTGTDLNATQTENAIKEVNTKVNTNAADITQLKSGLTNLGGRFAVVEGTNAAEVDLFTTVSMPSGFSAYNAVIIGFTSQFSNDLWYTNNGGLIVDANAETVYVKVKDAGFASKPFKVVLYKFA